jgi:hypothetical protein
MSAIEVCRIKHDNVGKQQCVGLSIDMSGKKLKYQPKGFTVGAGRSRLYGSSPQAKVTCEDLQMSLTHRRMSVRVSSCVECRVGSMAPLI